MIKQRVSNIGIYAQKSKLALDRPLKLRTKNLVFVTYPD